MSATDVLQRCWQLRQDRANFENIWQEVAERVMPSAANFTTIKSPGEERTEKLFDATASLDARKYSAFLESITTPHNQKYQRIRAIDPQLERSWEVQQYLEALNDLLLRYRYGSAANFIANSGSQKLELAVFGTGVMFVDEDPVYGLRYRHIPLAEAYLTENHVGMVDTVYRRFQMTAKNAVSKFGDNCPKAILEAASNNPNSKHWFVHCVEPGETQVQGQRWKSVYVAENGEKEVESSGYYNFPFAISRDISVPGEIYGRSPSMWMLPDIKMLNEMNKTLIRAAQKAVDPPVLSVEDGALQPFDMRPGRMNPGGLDPNGQELVKPFVSGSRVDIGLELIQAKQNQLHQAYYINLFQILLDDKEMTATEVLERAQEKGMLLGPLAGRDQAEFLGPLNEREIGLHFLGGRLPPMPPEFAEAGAEYKVEYESPLARAQRAEEGVAIVRTLETALPLADRDPSILDNFDMDETVRTLGSINGMAAKLWRTPEMVAAIRQERKQEQDMQIAAKAAPGVARAVKDVSEIGQAT